MFYKASLHISFYNSCWQYINLKELFEGFKLLAMVFLQLIFFQAHNVFILCITCYRRCCQIKVMLWRGKINTLQHNICMIGINSLTKQSNLWMRTPGILRIFCITQPQIPIILTTCSLIFRLHIDGVVLVFSLNGIEFIMDPFKSL